MSEASGNSALADRDRAVTTDPSTRDLGLAYLLAGLSAGAAVIHFAMVPSHTGDGIVDPVGFAVVGWFQLLIAGLILTRRIPRALYGVAVVGNLAVMGLWAWSRTIGLPVGIHTGVVEPVTEVDLLATALAAGVVVVASLLLLAPGRLELPRMSSAMACVAVLGLVTATLAVPGNDEGDDHAHGDGAVAAGGGDGHGAAGDHGFEMALVDQYRCDLDFNPVSYWEETEFLGVDTYGGGAMADHGHNSLVDEISSQPLGGRGSVHLDRLVSLTDQADGEAAAGRLVAELAEASEEEYQAWLHWVAEHFAGDHDHGGGPDDPDDHAGEHVGPQTWRALVDRETCDQLAEELALGRETALRFPTASDAQEGGYVQVTPYLPGIAAHYMNFAYVDDTFEIDKPEMLLYDGNGDDARIVGLSYYILLDGDVAPTQGFTGDNDGYHRHQGLCIRGGVVVGDSTLTAEECADIGGRKSGGTNAWMSHAWVVPGCESPWGVFSAVNPLLDGALAQESGNNDGACAASSVRDRYDLRPGRGFTPAPASPAGLASGDR